MTEISAKAVMELRGRTNAGVTKCREARIEAGGDLEKAVEILRTKGVTGGGPKPGRVSKEGVIQSLLGPGSKSGVLLEVNCETDFVARNANWRAFAGDLTQHALNSTAESLDALLVEPFSKGQGTVEEAMKLKAAETGEATALRRFIRFTAGAASIVAAYVHPGERIGAMIEVSTGKPSTLEADAFKALLKDLTMQIAAANPQFISRNDVPAAVVERERAIYTASDRLQGKPAATMEGILNGMLNKFFRQVCLMEQEFVKDPDQSMASLVDSAGKSLGDTLTIERFMRFALGGN